MEFRNATERAEPRPVFEKLYMGVALLLILILLLVGPILFFSSLNTLLFAANPVISGELTLSVNVETFAGVTSLLLFSASQDAVVELDQSTAESFKQDLSEQEVRSTLQQINFPTESDEYWYYSRKYQRLKDAVARHGYEMVTMHMNYEFQQSSWPMRSIGETVKFLNGSQAEQLFKMMSLNGTLESMPYLYLDDFFPRYRRLTAGREVGEVTFGKKEERRPDVNVILSLRLSDSNALRYWSIESADVAGSRPVSDQLSCTLVSDYVAHATGSQNEGTMSVSALYLGVVLTIGNLLRSLFKDSSKRVIYEEVPDTDLLIELCDGIYSARHQGNLETEYDLYHELIRIYRSPELLAQVSAPRSRMNAPES